MKQLRDEHLIDSYRTAIEWKLDEEFIELLRREIERRKLDIRKPDSVAAT